MKNKTLITILAIILLSSCVPMDWEYLANNIQQTSQALIYANTLNRYPFLAYPCSVLAIKELNYGDGVLVQLPNLAILKLRQTQYAYFPITEGLYMTMVYINNGEVYLDNGHGVCKYEIYY